jgi:RNA polymerase sigma-70 factor, ECF subfamily
MKTDRARRGPVTSSNLDFENLVALYYRDLYRFALGMTRSEADAYDLTQQTFYIWAKKGHQLRDAANVRSWLFTTLHREFLQVRRRQSCFSDKDWTLAAEQSGAVSLQLSDRIDARTMLRFLTRIDQSFRAPLVLFFLEDLSYKQIAEVLEIPLGTVQSRIARGKAHLYQLLTHAAGKQMATRRRSPRCVSSSNRSPDCQPTRMIPVRSSTFSSHLTNRVPIAA